MKQKYSLSAMLGLCCLALSYFVPAGMLQSLLFATGFSIIGGGFLMYFRENRQKADGTFAHIQEETKLALQDERLRMLRAQAGALANRWMLYASTILVWVLAILQALQILEVDRGSFFLLGVVVLGQLFLNVVAYYYISKKQG